MTKKKPAAGGKRRRKPRRKPAAAPMLKLLAAAAILAVAVLAAVAVFRWQTAAPQRPVAVERKATTARLPNPPAAGPRVPENNGTPKPAPAPAAPQAKPEPPAAPVYEVFPPKPPEQKPEEDALHAALPPLPPELPVPKKLPRVAIIIDDLGYNRQLAERLGSLGVAFTFAILPHSPLQEAIERIARAKGIETMLHLPMEPVEYPSVDPGPGALLTTMTPDELLQTLEWDLQALPHIKGVNNHMGSKLTASSEQMLQVFTVLKKHGLFFVDSRTAENSICKPSARLLQLPFAQRDVFLDHFQDPDFIHKQIRLLVRTAQQRGEAVGIAHPHAITFSILKEELPALRKQVEIVPASELVHIPG
jgi:polysaccharide deacetylase 2 family uncharacterized protein YibQ